MVQRLPRVATNATLGARRTRAVHGHRPDAGWRNGPSGSAFRVQAEQFRSPARWMPNALPADWPARHNRASSMTGHP